MKRSKSIFSGRKMLIATKHGKEKVIAPILEEYLGVECFTIDLLDTDSLGTFTGEIERKDDTITTARKKCLMAMEMAGCDLAIASEGSFGPHPSVFFAAADEEVLLFLDTKNNLEVTAITVSMHTNFNGRELDNEEQLVEFAAKVNFPSHALIIRKAQHDASEIVKGITDWQELFQHFQTFISNYGKAFVETDMRAMCNPCRMEVIGEAAIKLAEKLNTLCPNCKTPGFAVTEIIAGLRCEWCRLPTRSTLIHRYTCRKCKFSLEKKYPHQRQAEDPMYCDYCNP